MSDSLLLAKLAELTAERDKLKSINESLCTDWAEDDTQIKQLAESIGVQGDSNDGYFRNRVQVVEDIVAKNRALVAERDAAIDFRNLTCERHLVTTRERDQSQHNYDNLFAKFNKLHFERDALAAKCEAMRQTLIRSGVIVRKHMRAPTGGVYIQEASVFSEIDDAINAAPSTALLAHDLLLAERTWRAGYFENIAECNNPEVLEMIVNHVWLASETRRSLTQTPNENTNEA